MNEGQNSNNKTDLLGEFLPVFFAVLWVFAFGAWIVFVCKEMILEMWIANAFMWISLFGARIKHFD